MHLDALVQGLLVIAGKDRHFSLGQHRTNIDFCRHPVDRTASSRQAEPQRIPLLPDLPTVAETVPGFSMAPWVGIIVPAKTPKDVVARLTQETLAVMHEPEVIKLLNDQQVTPMAIAADEFGELIKKDLDRWANVVKTAGIRGE